MTMMTIKKKKPMTEEQKYHKHLDHLVKLTCTFLTGADLDEAVRDALTTYIKLLTIMDNRDYLNRGE
jgi:hypothetical protein